MSAVRDATARALLESSGWQALESPKPGEKAWEDMYRIAKLCADCYASPVGQEWLRHMVAVFLARPIVKPADTQFAAGIRQGQADVVLQILTNIEIAKRGMPQ